MLPDLAPVYEPIVPQPHECFVWRQDDYPLAWSIWNAHPECEIHLIRHAEGTCHVGDHIGSFADGDVFFVGRGLPHDWVTPMTPGELIAGRDIVLQFDEDRVLASSATMPEISRLDRFFVLARRGLVFEGDTRAYAARTMEQIGRTQGLERLALFLQLLHILSTSDEMKLLSSGDFFPQTDPAISEILRGSLAWISGNYSSDVRLGQLAAMADMTETSFSRFFKRNTGTTFSRYLSELRMAKACQLLVTSDFSITTISAEVGYDNLSNFNRTFRNLRGITPSQYRKSGRRDRRP